ncbi:hypothetical protein CKAN_01017300 [Cinnamomum micranthum f. kanehirae]|uniref:ABC1 atypical kinase-like domain-containing protein n=1 Tax=Cinnamomum micranthum f. kanehirae TaxID=337451 RepID=A0A3S3Q8Q7_9MAGN|nr:hypothetical protein CKAN_01017300 [Cinnamomum micranthum f. kanehirae]
MASSAAAAALPLSIYASSSSSSSPSSSSTRDRKNRRFTEFSKIVRKDKDFITQKLEWAKAVRFPALSKSLEDVFWLRRLEDPTAHSRPQIQWPQPSYPGLSGVDLLMADLMAIKAYADYLYLLSKIWSTPLPEIYDPQKVADYFNCRPHVVAFRVLEVFSSFATAAVKMRTSGIFKFNRFGKDRDDDERSSEHHFGHLLKETMLNLGPTFIKGWFIKNVSLSCHEITKYASYIHLLPNAVGQSLSTRPDIIGSEIAKALSELHDQIPPFPQTVAMKIIEEELGCPVESVYTNISDKPVAAASFGQVYHGVTFDGSTVAVKVQRPNLLHAVVRDIYILRLGLGLLQKVVKRKSDPRLYADELGRGLVGELDYNLEAENASQFLEAHRQFPFIYVPKFLTDESFKEIDCWPVFELKVNKGVEATLVQLLETGILHADPHPGNLRYTPAGQIGFLDFGLLCRMEKKHQFAMLASILHIVNGDWGALVYDLMEMDVVRPGTNLRRVTMELEDALGEVEFKDGVPDIKFSRVLGKIWSIALKFQFRMPPYYTLVLRSLASLEGLAVAADQDFKTFQTAYPYVVRKLLTDNSAATRRILHSVVFNKRKEFQWQKLSLFLRIGATRKSMHKLLVSDSGGYPECSANGPDGRYQVANLVMRLLLSKDGVVLRRLLMTADATSLVHAMISKEAIFFHRHVRSVLADLLHNWMIKAVGVENKITSYSSRMTTSNVHHGREMRPSSESSASLYQDILKDRRLKLIFSKVLNSIRKDPMLVLRFCWTSFVIFVSASALACHQFLVSWSEIYMTPISIAPKRVAVSV